jgi:hypothetical protein
MLKRRALVVVTVMVTIFGLSGSAFAQSDAQCEAFQAIIKSPPPSDGALASLEHSVAVLKAAIGMIDLPCGAPYIVSTDQAAISQERERLFLAWRQARENCLQITSGDPSDMSPCKDEISPSS